MSVKLNSNQVREIEEALKELMKTHPYPSSHGRRGIIQGIAKEYGVSEKTVYRWLKDIENFWEIRHIQTRINRSDKGRIGKPIISSEKTAEIETLIRLQPDLDAAKLYRLIEVETPAALHYYSKTGINRKVSYTHFLKMVRKVRGG